MKLEMQGSSLVRLAQGREGDLDCLFVTVGILADADGKVEAMADAEAWLAARFKDRIFDVGLKKGQGTFAVDGYAYPRDPSTLKQVASVRVGTITKSLTVHAPRHWQRHLLGWTPVDAGACSPVALTMENAYGGAGYADNPHGMGFVAPDQPAEGVSLPRLEHPQAPLNDPFTPVRCATFLPLPPFCKSRLRYMGTLDQAWKSDVAPFLPADTDARWFNEVDEDQWTAGYWSGRETWAAHGLHPSGNPVQGVLPGHRVRLLLNYDGQPDAVQEWPLDLDTVWLFPDEQKVLLLYRQVLRGLTADAEQPWLGAVAEPLDEAPATKEYWAAKLWPGKAMRPAPDLTAPQIPQPPTRDDVLRSFGPMIEAMEKSIDGERQAAVDGAKSLIERFGLKGVELPSSTPRPLLDRMLAASGKPSAFDPAAMQASLEQEVLSNRQSAIQHAQAMAKQMNLAVGPDGLPSTPSNTGGSDPMKILDQLPLDSPRRADLMARMEQLTGRSQQVETEIEKHMAKQRAEFASLPKLSPPKVGGFMQWKRPDFVALDGPKSFYQESFDTVDFSSLDLKTCHFIDCNFKNCSFNLTVLRDTMFENCMLTDCDLSEAAFHDVEWIGTHFSACDLSNVRFTDAVIDDLRLTGCKLLSADFGAARAKRLTLTGCIGEKVMLGRMFVQHFSAQSCDLQGADGRQANLPGARFFKCSLKQADFSGAQLSKAIFSNTDASLAVFTAANLRAAKIETESNFSYINAASADLSGVAVRHSNLEAANLSMCRLPRAIFVNANLKKVLASQSVAMDCAFHSCEMHKSNWSRANLMGTTFHRCVLEDIDARGANLHGVYLDRSQASRIDCTDALLTRSSFSEVNHAAH